MKEDKEGSTRSGVNELNRAYDNQFTGICMQIFSNVHPEELPLNFHQLQRTKW